MAKLLLCCIDDKGIIVILVTIFGSIGILLGVSAIGRLGWKIQTWSGETVFSSKNTSKSISVSHLASGIYLIQVQKESEVFQARFVKE
ncbi:MAG: T9SS type A sorting domain-containing protein [Bacteroidia bacterium]|nr:T9SS type A sorting domain-containing protein [Bacteroidia bacterium]MCO5255097.1 T9SS type A sorting domain-containing protein [Bacteroidota bacterium]